jgi:hypothetical protein
VLLLALGACGTSPQTVQLREAVATAGSVSGPAVAFRVPARRAAAVRVYALPALEPVTWRLDAAPVAPEGIVGLAADDGLLYAAAGDDLLALDLRSGRFRTLDSGVTRTAIGATGTVLALHGDGSLALAADRRLSPAGHAPGGRVEALWTAPGGRQVAVLRDDSGRAALVLAGGGVESRRAIPEGTVTPSGWGDAAVVVGPEGVALFDLLRDAAPLHLGTRDEPLAATFSASGHRVYVATARPELLGFDRFEGDRLERTRLPARVTALRADRFGRYLFGHADSGLVIVGTAGEEPRVVPGAWSDDLPAATPDGAVVLRAGRSVRVLAADLSTEQGRVAGGGADHWLVAPWDTRRPTLEAAAEAAGPPSAAVPGQQVYVQVSSTSNAQWADGLASDLRTAGMRASVLPPASADEMYRVVLGPYGTREEAEAIGRKLGMPYWIFTRDTTSTTP